MPEAYNNLGIELAARGQQREAIAREFEAISQSRYIMLF
jgi:hypothetical protein